MIYIFVFLISIFCAFIASTFRTKNRILFILFSILTLLFPCLLAAFRDYSIGTDVTVYISPLYHHALNFDSFYLFYLHPNSMINDVLYLATTYYSSKIGNDISALFFFNELLVIGPIYIALLRKYKNTHSIILGLIIFFCFFYNTSFNMARQSIALAFTVLAYTYLDDNKNLKFWLIALIAFMFHNTAAILIIVFILYKLYKSDKIFKSNKKIVNIICFVVVVLSFLYLEDLVNLLINNGINADKLSATLENYSRSMDINWVNTLFYIMIFLIIHFNKEDLKEKVTNFKFYYFISIVSIIILQFGSIIKYSERIGFYIFYPLIFLVLPHLGLEKKEKMKKKNIRNYIAIIGVFIIYWIFWIVFLQYHETYPYVFR